MKNSAGLNHDATVPLSPEQLKAADIIFVMEKTHRTKLSQRFGKYLNGQKIVTLHIPDHYQYMDPSLVELLKQKVSPHL